MQQGRESAGERDTAVPPRRRRPRRLSQMFGQLAHDAKGDVSVGAIRDALGDRSFAALLVIFAALNMIPLPPPASAFLGPPLMLIAAQMVYGSKRAWLPAFLTRRSLTAEQFRAFMDKVVPQLIRVEQYVRPRYWPFWRKRGDRVIGCIALLMGILITLPIPLGNWLPACCTALLGLSLTERDGVMLAIGGAVGIAALAVIVAVVGTGAAVTHFLYGWIM